MKRHAPTLDVLNTAPSANSFYRTKNQGVSIGALSHSGARTTMSSTVKPRILESKVSLNPEFYNLSDGFKKIFANDK